MSDNFIGVFDGVGQGGYWSGTFARELARKCSLSATVYTPNPTNRSSDILFEALEKAQMRAQNDQVNEVRRAIFTQVCQRTKKVLEPLHGSTTALVLSLVGKYVHDSVYGDCRWALLRAVHGKYEVKHVSLPMYEKKQSMGTRSSSDQQQNTPIPKQFLSSMPVRREHLEARKALTHGMLPVSEGDIIIAASDGFWDNAEIEWGKDEDLARGLAQCADAAALQTSVPLVKSLGQNLAKMAIERMDMIGKGKSDDLSIVVARVSYRLAHQDGHLSQVHGENCDRCTKEIQSKQGHAVHVHTAPS
jgi:serine/threonine protein phosphatase PrpC